MSTEVEFLWQKTAKSRFVPPFGGFGLFEKRVIDLLLVLIERVSLNLTVEAHYKRILVEIVVFERGWVI